MTTYAPHRLLEVRAYLQPIVKLPNNALGITGDQNHDGGYHHGWNQRDGDGDYSWDESPRDWNHKTEAASGFDLGWFDVWYNDKQRNLIDFNLWFVEQLKAGAPDTLNVREFIYTPDGKTVKRWDRLGIRSSGDSSHLTHSHIGYFRDAEEEDKTGPFKRYFGDDMSWQENLTAGADAGGGTYPAKDWLIGANWKAWDSWENTEILRAEQAEQTELLKELLTMVGELAQAGGGSVDTAAILRGVDDRLAAQREHIKATAEAHRKRIEDAIADLGEGGAAKVRSEIDSEQ